jgi:hypothetical protein
MADYLQDSFEELIPGAGDKGKTFLQVITDRAAQENLGLVFIPKQVKKSDQVVLEASIQFGGTFSKAAPMKLVVHADPVGNSLQVGWQLASTVSAFNQYTPRGRMNQAKMEDRAMSPENQRKMSGILTAFHKAVFLPVLGMLVDAVQTSSRPQGGGGFLGA